MECGTMKKMWSTIMDMNNFVETVSGWGHK